MLMIGWVIFWGGYTGVLLGWEAACSWGWAAPEMCGLPPQP